MRAALSVTFAVPAKESQATAEPDRIESSQPLVVMELFQLQMGGRLTYALHTLTGGGGDHNEDEMTGSIPFLSHPGGLFFAKLFFARSISVSIYLVWRERICHALYTNYATESIFR